MIIKIPFTRFSVSIRLIGHESTVIPFPKKLEGLDAVRDRMTFARLAREIGVTRAAISQWEKVPAERLGAVSRATGIPMQVLRPDLFKDAVEELDAEGQPVRKDINAYRKIDGARNHRHALKVWRKANGITQAEMAETLGIGKWMVTAIETGRRVPSFALVQKIVSATDGAVQPNDIFMEAAAA